MLRFIDAGGDIVTQSEEQVKELEKIIESTLHAEQERAERAYKARMLLLNVLRAERMSRIVKTTGLHSGVIYRILQCKHVISDKTLEALQKLA